MTGMYLVVGLAVVFFVGVAGLFVASMVMAALSHFGHYNPPKYTDEIHRLPTNRHSMINLGYILWVVLGVGVLFYSVGWLAVELSGVAT